MRSIKPVTPDEAAALAQTLASLLSGSDCEAWGGPDGERQANSHQTRCQFPNPLYDLLLSGNHAIKVRTMPDGVL
jgi:hypothetical protein